MHASCPVTSTTQNANLPDMKRYLHFYVITLAALLILQACGNGEEQRQREQAQQDSMVEAQQRKERARLDSLAQARADSIARKLQSENGQNGKDQVETGQAQKETERETQPASSSRDYSFDAQGRFTVQVESWRNRSVAEKRLKLWKDRGFDQAYISEHGNEDTGEVWYRIRLGHLSNKQQAQNLKQHVMDQYNSNSWVAISRGASS